MTNRIPTLFLSLTLAALAPAAVAQTPGQQFMDNWDLNADGTATLEELEQMRGNVFFTFDADENGFLDAEEYVMFDEARANDVGNYQGAQRKQMGKVADAMSLSQNDRDGDGKVSRAEFVAGAADWLARIDRNGDGVVTTEDFGR